VQDEYQENEKLNAEGLWALRADGVGSMHAQEIACALCDAATHTSSALPSDTPGGPGRLSRSISTDLRNIDVQADDDLSQLRKPLKALRFVSLARNASDVLTAGSAGSAEAEARGPELGRVLGAWLGGAPRLTTLELAGNALGWRGVEELARSLDEHGTLTHLDLASNDMQRRGAESLAKALARNHTLRSLNVSENRLQSGGALVLLSSLGAKQMVEMMDLSGNEMLAEGAVYVALRADAPRKRPPAPHLLGLIR
jgi:hypothetical protein